MFVLTLLALLFAGAIAHSYLLYPWIVRRTVRASSPPPAPAAAPSNYPDVHVLMAVHNEEAVLPQKLASLLAQDYPGTLRFYVGSDNSTDATNAILTEFERNTGARSQVRRFGRRQGKPAIINQLAELAGTDGCYLLTDASVMLQPGTVTALIDALLAHPGAAVVDARVVHTGLADSGISKSEDLYIGREVALKHNEGRAWGAMMGPFGGCWLLRAAAFRPVPDNFLVDDFYLCMSAYEAGGRGVSALDAVVTEGVGQSVAGEFRRKARIGAGNWQNLVRFRKLWWPFWRSPLHFAFFSHKVLRWWTPLLLIGLLSSLVGRALLAGGNHSYWWPVALVAGLPLLGYLADVLLSALGLRWPPLRHLRYFLAMNAALLVGLLRYLNGIQTNVWQPSTRHPHPGPDRPANDG